MPVPPTGSLAAVLRVMVVTDGLHGGPPETLVERIAAAVRGGATCVQVRLKELPAQTVVEVTRAIVARIAVPVLVNDRFDVALAAGADGVHLGAEDVPVTDVRRVVPPGFIIGASVGNDAEIANAAQADYVGIGPVFATGSKDDAGEAIGVAGFARLAAMVGKPAVGIGGITVETARAIIDAGGIGIAAISALMGTPDGMRDGAGGGTTDDTVAPELAARCMVRAIGR